MASRVSVFIDYQNVHLSAHEMWCALGEPLEDCIIHPQRLAELVVDRRPEGGDLKDVHVFRGRPDPRKQARIASANDKQAQAWSDAGSIVHRRPLRYPHDWGEADCFERPREKGVDVALAVNMVRLAIQDQFDVGILISRDTDLLPALEAIRELGGPIVEVATWESSSRLRLPGPDLACHMLSEADFRAVHDSRYYGPNKPYSGPRMNL